MSLRSLTVMKVCNLIRNIVKTKWHCLRRTNVYVIDIPSVLIDFGNDDIHFLLPESVKIQDKYSYGISNGIMLGF